MMRVSYVGELGWEIYTSADIRRRAVGPAVGGRPGARRHRRGPDRVQQPALEKGYRLWGTDMTAEHHPSRPAWTSRSRMDKDDFVGKAALDGAPTHRQHARCAASSSTTGTPWCSARSRSSSTARLRRLRHQRRLLADRRAHHRLRLAARRHATVGDAVTVDYRGTRFAATVHAEPVVDPEMARIKR